MKILVVQESDWLNRNPHQQHHLMDRLAVLGHEIRVIDYDIDWRKNENKGLFVETKIYKDIYKVKSDASIDVIRPALVQFPVFDYLSILYFHRREIKNQIEEFKPDIIMGLGLLNTNIAARLADKHDIPFVYYLIDVLYTLIPEKTFQKFGKRVTEDTLKRSDMVLAINKKLLELSISLGADQDKSYLVDAGIDLNEFDTNIDTQSLEKEYGINDDDIVLFFMGWIYHFAGIKELALDLAKNKSKYSNIKLLIVGDGDAFDDLESIQGEYDLGDQLILTGKKPYSEIPKFISMSSICLLPAYKDEEIMQDIVPIKIYEYLAMEKPVIVTKLPGIYVEFGENNGLVYVNDSSEVLGIVEDMKNKNIIYSEGLKGKSFVKLNDWNIITQKFENLLEKLIETKKDN